MSDGGPVGQTCGGCGTLAAPWSFGRYVSISVFWLGVSFHWTALLSIVLQVRVAQLVEPLERGLSLAVVSAVGALVSILVELMAGPLSDRCSSPMGRRRPFVLWGTLLTLPFVLLFMRAGAFPWLVIHFALIQLFLNWANGPYQAVIPDQVPPGRHGLASAYMGMMQLLGTAGGLAVAGLTLADRPVLLAGLPIESRLTAVGAALCAALLGTMAWTVLGMREDRWVPASAEERRITLAHVLDIRLREHADFRRLICSRFCFNLGFSTVVLFMTEYLRDSIGLRGQAPFWAFVLFETATLAGVGGNWVGGVVSDRTSKKRVMYLAAAVLGAATVAFLACRTLVPVLLIGGVFGIAWGAFAAVDWALASNLVPRREAGRYMAIWHIAMTAPQVAAPLFAGPVADRLNSVSMGLGWRAALALIPLYLVAGVLFLRPIQELPSDRESEPGDAGR